MKTLDHCEWRVDPVAGRWFLPVCWGAVNAGPDGCYCDEGPSTSDRLTAIEEGLAAVLAALSGREGSQ